MTVNRLGLKGTSKVLTDNRNAYRDFYNKDLREIINSSAVAAAAPHGAAAAGPINLLIKVESYLKQMPSHSHTTQSVTLIARLSSRGVQ